MSVVFDYTTDRFGRIPRIGEVYSLARHGRMVCRDVTPLEGGRFSIRAALLPPPPQEA